jgi:hypothetical protein
MFDAELVGNAMLNAFFWMRWMLINGKPQAFRHSLKKEKTPIAKLILTQVKIRLLLIPKFHNPCYVNVQNIHKNTTGTPSTYSLVHLADEAVDELLTVTSVSTLDEVLELALAETTVGGRELEGPEEVRGLLEVGANSEDLVDEILNGDDAELAEGSLNEGVVGEGNALALNLSVSTLVDQLADGLEVGFTIGDPRLNNAEHLNGSLGETDEDTVVDLEETEQLQDLTGLGGNLVDTEGYVRIPRLHQQRNRKTYPLMRTTKASLG